MWKSSQKVKFREQSFAMEHNYLDSAEAYIHLNSLEIEFW